LLSINQKPEFMAAHKEEKIIYVNFSPYENAGYILDYILLEYTTVIVFNFNYHELGIHKSRSLMTVYRNGKKVQETRIYNPSATPKTILITLPIRSLVIIFQIIWQCIKMKKMYGKFGYFLSVNALTSWAGNILRKMDLVDRTIYWVWDYYPYKSPNFIESIIRRIYWMFDVHSCINSNRTVYLHPRLYQLRQKIGILPENKKYPVIGIGTKISKKYNNITSEQIRLVFFGVIKKSLAMDILIDEFKSLEKMFKNLTLDIIGSGPDESYYRQISINRNLKIKFHGFIDDNKQVDKILGNCHIGLAVFSSDPDSVSRFTDSSKIKRYLSLSLPVIVSGFSNFHDILKYHKCGLIIPEANSKNLNSAIKKIVKKYSQYCRSAYKGAIKYDYRMLYPNLFR